MPSRRILQINELLRKHLGEIIAREVDFKPDIIVTISKVDTPPDLRNTRVSVSVLPESEEHYAMETLRKERLAIQKLLHSRLYMKPLPKVTFVFDPTESHADEVEHLLKAIEDEPDS